MHAASLCSLLPQAPTGVRVADIRMPSIRGAAVGRTGTRAGRGMPPGAARRTRVWCLLVWCLLALPAAAHAETEQAVTVPQRELAILAFHRPPYYTFANGKAGGFLIDAVRRMLDAARIPYRITEMPPKRILMYLEQDADAYACSPGWYRTREREEFARFSAPIYRNLPPVAVLRADMAHRASEGKGLSALLAAELRLVLRGGFSYGGAIDEALARSRAPIYRSTADNAALLEMLASGRYDMTLMEQEEAAELLRLSPRLHRALVLVPLAQSGGQAQAPQTRHLMCGRGVDEALMRHIDDAIASVLPGMPGDTPGDMPDGATAP